MAIYIRSAYFSPNNNRERLDGVVPHQASINTFTAPLGFCYAYNILLLLNKILLNKISLKHKVLKYVKLVYKYVLKYKLKKYK